uniref:Uncharacterized protein n=1 Tax=Arundo donax TaxID=35708 RepID=A0A0A9H398_ARUDO
MSFCDKSKQASLLVPYDVILLACRMKCYSIMHCYVANLCKHA